MSSYQTIITTENAPLIIVTGGSRGMHIAKKYWQTSAPNEIFSSTCKFGKSIASEGITWSKPKCLVPKNTTASLLLYSPELNLCKTAFILDSARISHRNLLPMPLEEYVEFAMNPAHQFTPEQFHTIHMQLRSWMPNEQETEFVAQKSNNPPSPFTPFPTTLEDALANLTHAKEQKETPNHPPILSPVQQPEEVAPICIANLIATNHYFPRSKPKPMGDCFVFLKVTPQGKQNSRREVFYAYPVNSNKPSAVPISPLKSTVAILYADVNPASHTFNQPVIVAINTATCTDAERADFLLNHTANLNQIQALQFATTTSSTTPPTNQEAKTMYSTLCKFCKTEILFEGGRTPIYCSPKCRIDYNAGKTFGEAPKRKATNAPVEPTTQASPQASTDAPVTQAQFQALNSRVDQLIQLLTPKD